MTSSFDVIFLILLPFIGGVYITMYGWGKMVKDDFRNDEAKKFWNNLLPVFKWIGPIIIVLQLFVGVVMFFNRVN